MISLREIQQLLVNKSFNPYIKIDKPKDVLLHLVEEIGEVVKAFNKEFNEDYTKYYKPDLAFEKLKKELGDVVILLCFFSESVRIDLEKETLLKIAENIRKRKFQPDKKKLKEFNKEIGGLFG